MQKFTNHTKQIQKEEKEETNIPYEGEYLSIVHHNGWDIKKESDKVIVLPILKDEGYVLLRSEYIPTFQLKYKDVKGFANVTNFLTCISGTMEDDETVENCIRRELYEEAGIVISNVKQITIDKSLHVDKGNLSRYHICMMELNSGDYKMTMAPTDGSKEEKLSKTIKVSIGDLDEIQTWDLITDYILTKMKLDYGY